jgi:hypothetical protein
VSDKESARWILAQLRNDSRYEPFAAAVASLADKALRDAGVPKEQAAAAAIADAAYVADAPGVAKYYKPALREVMASALQLLLQVRGTANGLFVYLPGGLMHVVQHLKCHEHLAQINCGWVVAVQKWDAVPHTMFLKHYAVMFLAASSVMPEAFNLVPTNHAWQLQ